MKTPPLFHSRRELLRHAACGFGALAFNGLFASNAPVENPLLPKKPHFPARAKRVIFLFMCGGPSQVDTFDFKPALTKRHNEPTAKGSPNLYYQSPWEFKQHGQSGLAISSLLPNMARHADDLCVIN